MAGICFVELASIFSSVRIWHYYGKSRSAYEQERHPEDKVIAIARLRGVRRAWLVLRVTDVFLTAGGARIVRVPRFARAALVVRAIGIASGSVRVIGIVVRVPRLV